MLLASPLASGNVVKFNSDTTDRVSDGCANAIDDARTGFYTSALTCLKLLEYGLIYFILFLIPSFLSRFPLLLAFNGKN